jgi:serine/threonine protein kinase
MDTDERLGELVARWEEARRRGEDIPTEDFCKDCPELIRPFARRIAASHLVELLPPRAPEPGPPFAVGEGAEPIPGYHLLRRLGRGGFGEVWEAQNPRGDRSAVKIVPPGRCADGELGRGVIELDGLERVMAVSSPWKLWIERYEVIGGTLVIACEIADGPLADHLEGVRRQHPEGRVVAECLYHLSGAAELLDLMAFEYWLMHGDVKPSNLLMADGVCKVADFGTVSRTLPGRPAGEVLLWTRPAGGNAVETHRFGSHRDVPWEQALRPGVSAHIGAGCFTPLYAPPEAFVGVFHPTFDQYSLALTFCELAFGRPPFPGPPAEQIARRCEGRPDLSFLPAPMRPAVERALAVEPGQRFGSCRDFLAALREAHRPAVQGDAEAEALLDW